MELETVSKIKGTVALVCLAYVLAVVFLLNPKDIHGPFGQVASLALVVGCIYLVKWLRLRRYMRVARYAARIARNG